VRLTVSNFHTRRVDGPGWSPTYPPTIQMVLPSATVAEWVVFSGRSGSLVQLSAAVS
jgi:hypothetical protein